MSQRTCVTIQKNAVETGNLVTSETTACLGIQVGAGIDGHQVLVWYGINHLNIHSAMCISR